MVTRTFMVLDDTGKPIAKQMDLKTALILVEGLFNTYYEDVRGWTIIPDSLEKEGNF